MTTLGTTSGRQFVVCMSQSFSWKCFGALKLSGDYTVEHQCYTLSLSVIFLSRSARPFSWPNVCLAASCIKMLNCENCRYKIYYNWTRDEMKWNGMDHKRIKFRPPDHSFSFYGTCSPPATNHKPPKDDPGRDTWNRNGNYDL